MLDYIGYKKLYSHVYIDYLFIKYYYILAGEPFFKECIQIYSYKNIGRITYIYIYIYIYPYREMIKKTS